MGGFWQNKDIHFWALVAMAAIGAISLLLILLAIKPVKTPVWQESLPQVAASQDELTFAWPEQGSAAIAMDGEVKASHKGDQIQPTASVAKVITALMLLEKKPLLADAEGESLIMGDEDVKFYEAAKGGDQSLLEIKKDQKITEKQLLEGMMLASANNLANSAAVWAYGSTEAYVSAANGWLASNGFSSTTVADASGLSKSTVSSANDLVRLAARANENAALKAIFATKTAQFPGVGEITNTNLLLGVDGIFGVKTGHTDAAGANLLFASKVKIKGEEKTVFGVVLGQADDDLFTVAQKLNRSAQDNLSQNVILPVGTAVGEIVAAWGDKTPVVLAEDLTAVGWKDEVNPKLEITVLPEKLALVSARKVVGVVKSNSSEVNLVTEKAIFEPNFGWKITHPF